MSSTPPLRRSQRGGEIHGRGGLTDAAFLIGDGDDAVQGALHEGGNFPLLGRISPVPSVGSRLNKAGSDDGGCEGVTRGDSTATKTKN